MYSPVAEQLISAEAAVAAIHDYAALRFYRGAVLGVSFDAASGCNRLCRFEDGQAASLLPDHFSVRSRVHEYGGGAWCLADELVCFVNDTDQQIWLVSCTDTGRPRQLTTESDTRFADLQPDMPRNRLIAISESHGVQGREPVNRLVAIDLGTGAMSLLAAGADFYSSPVLSPDGRQLAWVEWDHPQQPWRCTRLLYAQLNVQGQVEQRTIISDTSDAAWLQPRFSPEGQLHVVLDREDWWRIERYTPAGFRPLSGKVPASTEFTTAPWQFGLSTYGWDKEGDLLALGQCEGYSHLWRHDGRDWQSLELGGVPARLHSLAMDGDRFACVAEFSDRLPAILSIDSALTADDPDQVEILHGGQSPDYVPCLPISQYAECGNDRVPYFLYRPADVPSEQTLPLVIWTHGGPTAMAAPVFKPAIQYWTQRGFMIADVNYRGSTGYGREYRMRLAGRWGIRDVEDVESVARSLILQGGADPEAIFIRGNSAGGYTTLSALCRSDLFGGGASLYGVSDPLRLNRLTHKFESRYLFWLIGDPETEADRYQERSPLHNAGEIRVPVIFFQGQNDRVVLPQQTRCMVECLAAQGISTEAHWFENEAHGFRHPENQVKVLEMELRFYRDLMT